VVKHLRWKATSIKQGKSV